MPAIMAPDFGQLLERAISHKATLDSALIDIRENEHSIAEAQKKLNNLLELNETTRFSYQYLDNLVKEESGRFIKKLNDILDYGIKTIFFDCDYSIEIRVSDNNKATIHLVYDDADGNHLEPNIQYCGGGVKAIVGSLMQIAMIFQYKVEPILFVDEGWSAISSQYVEGFFALLDELAQKNDLKILLITHDERFKELATVKRKYVVTSDGYIREEDGDAANNKP